MGTMRAEKESREADLVSKFMDEMMPTKLFCRSPNLIFDYWVFWSHNHTSICFDIQNRIKHVFCDSFNHTNCSRDVLVQFWGAEGELHLTTALQPFALSNIENEKLKEYRKHCAGYKLLVADEEASGIVGRVFRNRLPEFAPEPEYYSVREYPQRDFAIRCGINSMVALPVFQNPGVACVGVLELLLLETLTFLHHDHVGKVNRALKEQGLRTVDMLYFSSQVSTLINQIDEIETAAKHRLAVGVIWVSFQGELVVPSPEMSFFANSPKELLTFVDHWSWSGPLTVNGGLVVVGKAYSSDNLHFCRDVSQLTISEYPQVLFARKLGLAACFTACLRNISTGNHELVIEFSLSRETTYNQDPHSLFSSILATMNQQLRSFKVVTVDMYIDIANETHKQREQSSYTSWKTISSSTKQSSYTSWKTITSSTKSEGDSLQSLGTTECSMMSTCKKPVWPSLTRVNESDQFIPESSLPVNTSAQRAESECSAWGNSETASTNWVKLFGHTIYGHQSNIPVLNRSRAESLTSGMPLSEASAIYADVDQEVN